MGSPNVHLFNVGSALLETRGIPVAAYPGGSISAPSPIDGTRLGLVPETPLAPTGRGGVDYILQPSGCGLGLEWSAVLTPVWGIPWCENHHKRLLCARWQYWQCLRALASVFARRTTSPYRSCGRAGVTSLGGSPAGTADFSHRHHAHWEGSGHTDICWGDSGRYLAASKSAPCSTKAPWLPPD
jgi:hypothetical protein